MNEFIHTFSANSYLFALEKDKLQEAYREDFFYNSEERHFVLSKYAERGLRIQIKFTKNNEKKYDKKHRDCKVEFIITPAKLLYPGETMQKLFNKEDYIKAIENLKALLGEIELQSGINLWREVKIKRIDLAKDIGTPSDEFSQEVIRIAKKALYKTGYKLFTPTEEDVKKTDWSEKDSILFNNHNQGVNSKIYNKLQDMKNQGLDTMHIKGLLRFELSLKRDYLKRLECNGTHISLNELSSLLCSLLERSAELMQKYIAGPLWSGGMLSKELQKKFIKINCKSKKAKYQKMISYRTQCNRYGIDRNDHSLELFDAISLSPLYVGNEFRYIPSFSNLLSGTTDERIERFLKFY
jgi:hypothetical protein